MDVEEKKEVENSFLKANIISKLLLFWVWPFFGKGYKNSLTIKDIPDAPPDDQAKCIADSLLRNWESGIQTENPIRRKELLPNGRDVEHRSAEETPVEDNKGFSLILKALIATFGYQYFSIWPVMIFTDCFARVLQPWFMLLIIRSFLEESPERTTQYLLAVGVCITTFYLTLANNPCLLYMLRLGMRSTIALSSLIQRKMMKLSHCQTGANAGELVTLMSNDAGRLEQYIHYMPYLLIGPIQLAIFMGFLWKEFGISSLAGVGFIILSLPFQYWNGSKSTEFRQKIGKETEKRTQILNETITGMSTIKMYTWENIFRDIINNCRESEVKMLKKRSSLHAFYMSIFLTSSRLVPFLTFLTFVLGGGPLTADRVFFAIAVYNTATHFLGFFVLSAVRGIGEVVGSLQRIQAFLLLPEKTKNNMYSHELAISKHQKQNFKLSNVSARWSSNSDPILRDIDLDLSGDNLVIIVGSVGSGKSSLLQLLLAELPVLNGNCSIRGRISYAQQVPWIFDGTIKKNIIFNEEFKQDRYNRVIEASGLATDLEQLPQGDMTLVGDRGTSLSGGQKARVNLARALYREADIYLLDDPLSAVDSSVGLQLFGEISNGFLKGRLRILVTHQHQYLSQLNQSTSSINHNIVFIKEKKVFAKGSYADLKSNKEFMDFVTTKISGDVDTLLDKRETTRVKITPESGEEESREEEQATGSLGFKIYWDYFKAAEAKFQFTFYFLMFIISQIVVTFIEYWLVLWTNAEEAIIQSGNLEKPKITNSSEAEISFDMDARPSGYTNLNATVQEFSSSDYLRFLENLDQNTYLYVYVALTSAVFVTNITKAIGFFCYCIRICNNIHKRMLSSLVRAQPTFFHTNPAGRVMNRFSKDIGVVDEAIPFAFFDMFTIFLQIGTVIFLIILANWCTVFPIILFLITLVWVRKYYVATSRDLKRIDGTTKSPIFSHLLAAHSGLVTIRACEAGGNIIYQFDKLQDVHTSTQFMFLATTRCFDIWIETIATFLLTVVTFSFLLAQNYLEMSFLGGNVGLAICSAMSLTNWLQYGMRTSAEVENLMVSVERALEYTKLIPEAELESREDTKPSSDWPQNGSLKFDAITMTYRGLCPKCKTRGKNVLNKLSFDILPGEKIGIVGRTGAGKSSLLWALFRMTELHEGNISIDDLPIDNIGLHDLRKSITIIPQDPVLFQESLRFNLEPSFGVLNNRDAEMNAILRKVQLNKSLEYELTSGGNNLSVGERQLVSLARAFLQKKKIIAMDEATASVDPNTDALIQKLIREELKSSTVLTIAHRLDTVIDSDKILVIQEGSPKEFGVPHILLQNKNGALALMVKDTGPENEKNLKEKAVEAYMKMMNGKDRN